MAPPPPRWSGDWLLGAVPFAANAVLRLLIQPSRWSGDGLLGIVPFAAAAAPRLRASRWSGDGLLGIMTFAAAAALRLRPFRWSGDGLPGIVPFAAVVALRLRLSLFLQRIRRLHLKRNCEEICAELRPLPKRGRVAMESGIPISLGGS